MLHIISLIIGHPSDRLLAIMESDSNEMQFESEPETAEPEPELISQGKVALDPAMLAIARTNPELFLQREGIQGPQTEEDNAQYCAFCGMGISKYGQTGCGNSACFGMMAYLPGPQDVINNWLGDRPSRKTRTLTTVHNRDHGDY